MSENVTMIIVLVQVFFGVIIGLYFWKLLRNQRSTRSAVDRESRKEMDKLRKMRSVSLTEPLSKKPGLHPLMRSWVKKRTQSAESGSLWAQPTTYTDLWTSRCRKDSRSPGGTGRSQKKSTVSLQLTSKFVEIDATTARFDERGIADPLIGSVHDPIYQGAGAMGMAGIPNPNRSGFQGARGGTVHR